MFCISNGSNEGLELFEAFGKAKASEGFVEHEYARYRKSYEDLEERRYTIGALYYWAKYEDLERYNSIMTSI